MICRSCGIGIHSDGGAMPIRVDDAGKIVASNAVFFMRISSQLLLALTAAPKANIADFLILSGLILVRRLLRSGTPVERRCDHHMFMVRKEDMGLCLFRLRHQPTTVGHHFELPPPPRQRHIFCACKCAIGCTTRPFVVLRCFAQFQNVTVTGRTTHVPRD